MELNYFKDILFDHINEWDQDILDIVTVDREDLFWITMGDGSVFQLHCSKADSAPADEL